MFIKTLFCHYLILKCRLIETLKWIFLCLVNEHCFIFVHVCSFILFSGFSFFYIVFKFFFLKLIHMILNPVQCSFYDNSYTALFSLWLDISGQKSLLLVQQLRKIRGLSLGTVNLEHTVNFYTKTDRVWNPSLSKQIPADKNDIICKMHKGKNISFLLQS